MACEICGYNHATWDHKCTRCGLKGTESHESNDCPVNFCKKCSTHHLPFYHCFTCNICKKNHKTKNHICNVCKLRQVDGGNSCYFKCLVCDQIINRHDNLNNHCC